jgi:hypothetical protein
LVSAAEHHLAASLLWTFPSKALTDPTVEDRHDAGSALLRRKVASIDKNAHAGITVPDRPTQSASHLAQCNTILAGI